MKTTSASHLDHNLTEAHIAYLTDRYAGRTAFFIETVELPESLPALQCNLYGPLMGDEPVVEGAVTYAARGERQWLSRTLCGYQPRPTRLVTVIAGPHDGEPCVLYTAFGGPLAPQEVGDPDCKDRAASEAFWQVHALVP